MAASPVNGERPALGAFRRSSSQFASLPQRSLSVHERAGLAKDDAAANVLYAHPNVRIYKFQPPTDALQSLDKTKKTLPDADYPIDAIEILPWRARTETLSSKGKMIIEKVQGSAHFLKSGNLIHTIMKNSQCWCVDGESKFVMRVGRLIYQRIEFPTAEPEEKEKVEEFKKVISKILKFERTPCPFVRSFHIGLPEDAITPRRRGTWKRRESLTPSTPEEDQPMVRTSKASRAMSLRGMPPSAFPSRSVPHFETERPRTASTPISSARHSFPDVRTESPTIYTSGEEQNDSDRPDSESERADSSHNSEAEDHDREPAPVSVSKSPLNHVETVSRTESRKQAEPQHRVRDVVSAFNGRRQQSPTIPISNTKGFSMSYKTTVARNRASLDSQPDLVEKQPFGSTPDQAASRDSADVATSPPESLDSSENHEHMSQFAQSISPIETSITTAISRERSSSNGGLPMTELEVEVDKAMDRDVEQNSTVSPPLEEVADLSLPESDAMPTAEVVPQASVDRIESLHAGEWHDDVQATDKSIESSQLSFADLTRAHTDDDAESMVSIDSYHTLLSDDSEAPTPNVLATRTFQHRRELSEMTIRPDSMAGDIYGTNVVPTVSEHDELATSSSESPRDYDSWQPPPTPGSFADNFEIRNRLRHRRSFSPMPPASIIATSSTAGRTSPMPKEILQKAATLAVVKPIEVVILVVHILARIAGGATMNDLMSGNLFRRPGTRRTATGTFDQNISIRPESRGSEEDDFGLPVRGRKRSINHTSNQPGPGQASSHDDDETASLASID